MRITRKQMSNRPDRQVVNAHTSPRSGHKICGHHVHVGTCVHCQRAQLARWREQLARAS
jgi:hypothetical protein